MPWTALRMREGGTVLLSGNKGSGKTSICMKTRPTLFISTEQELEEVSHSWYRIMGEESSIPLLTSCYSWEQIEHDLLTLKRGDRVIVDSISQLATGPESKDIVKEIIERVRRAGATAWFIAQFTKQGDMLGPNMLNHMVDVVCTIPDDDLGMRRLSTSKNRFGDLFSRYFALGADGVTEQDFSEYAYSVEGSAGNYSLHLYPQGGAKLAGIFDELSDNGVFIEGYASSAIRCRAYRSGYAQPTDVERRRIFAEDHGLTWVSPEQAQQMVNEAMEGRGATREM